MTRCVSAERMRAIEHRALESDTGLTAEILMGRAGRALADAVREHFPSRCRIAVVCGKGNNGGDGYAAASFLCSDYDCSVWSAAPADPLSAASTVYHSSCMHKGLLVGEFPDLDAVECIIDCLTGIGFSGRSRSELADLIGRINASGAWTVSADMPSGLPSDGDVDPAAAIVRADCTVTFGVPKRNCMLYPGRSFTGKLIVADIGLPSDTDCCGQHRVYVVDEHSVSALAIAPPAYDAHKYRNGHCAVVGGFSGMEGAALMAADAALETGIGLCSILTEDASRPILAGRIPEVMTFGLHGSSDSLQRAFAEYFLHRKVTTLLLGPGLGRGDFSRKVYGAVLAAAAGKIGTILLDGDALWFLAETGAFNAGGSALVLTPHAGEASKLLGADAAQISRDPFAAAVRLCEMYGCTAVMKGPSTVVAGKNRRFINMSGNPALASGGSGDVLAGICAALLARGLTPDHAAAAAVYIHGRAADNLVSRSPVHILRAADIIRGLRNACAGIFLPLD
jgi:NAD(P)H-hydrate epimerase